MNYTFTIRKVEPKLMMLGVIYHVEGREDYYKNFKTDNFSAENVISLVTGFAPQVRGYWESYDANPGDAEVSEGDSASGLAELHYYDDQPDIDPLTQNLEQTEDFDPATNIRRFGWTVTPASQTEISARKAAAAERSQADPVKLQKAQALVTLKTIDINTLSDEEVADIAVLYPAWKPDGVYKKGDIRLYDGVLWVCEQAHPAQADRAPEFVPALWTKYRDPVAGPQPWVQPTGAQDAYGRGERTTHDNPNDAGNQWIYESAIPANTTEPGRDGTLDRYWTPISPV